MDTASWQAARLIPVAGIRGQEEQEARATSSFLAVLRAVPDLAYALFVELGAPKGRIETFTEVRLSDAAGKSSRPDGAVVMSRGSRAWSALIEVKTGTAELTVEQTNRYLDLAREHGFAAVVTISNEITATPTDSPVDFDKRKTKKVDLYHLSWWRILTTAIVQHRHRGITDPDQAWILGELIAYLDHENSGASGFRDMGSQWVTVRDGARQGTLRAGEGTHSVVTHWEQYIDYLALGLSQDLGGAVEAVRPKKQTLAERLAARTKELIDEGKLTGAIRIPDAAADMTLMADLRARQVTTSAEVTAPRDGARQLTRVNWLVRQLADAPSDVRLTAFFKGVRSTSSVLLAEARERPASLLSADDPRREIRSFEVAVSRSLGMKNGRVKGSFVADTRQQLIDFYGDVLQNVHAWQPAPRRLPATPRPVEVSPQPDPPPFAAASEREVGEGRLPYDDEPSEADATAATVDGFTQVSEPASAPEFGSAASEPCPCASSEPATARGNSVAHDPLDYGV